MPHTKIIVTLGPATRTEDHLRKIKDRGVDFVRVNMSHSSIDDLRYFMKLARKVGIPFIVDTEGSQIRTGDLEKKGLYLEENEEVRVYGDDRQGGQGIIVLKPGSILSQLESGDLLYLDFDTLVLRVDDTASLVRDGYIHASVVTAGILGKNKGVVVDSAMRKRYDLPVLTPKDYEAISVGLEEGARHIAASFMRSPESVREVRSASKGAMKIISKIECIDGLENLDGIIEESDYLLVDRGDLSKEIPIERIPFAQKAIIERARVKGKGVFVATNLLETMVEKRKPTRAEVHDIQSTVIDGAYGLTLAAETAIGKYPLESITTLQKVVNHVRQVVLSPDNAFVNSPLAKHLEGMDYLTSPQPSSSLIEPHGGMLVERFVHGEPSNAYLSKLSAVTLTDEQYMDAEQVAIGTFSPLQGFMGEKDFKSVLDSMRLSDGTVWPIPIVLDVDNKLAAGLKEGTDVVLRDKENTPVAILHLKEKYIFDPGETAQKLYGTINDAHPGVSTLFRMKPVLLGGEIDLIRRRRSEFKAYEITPRQTRRLFEERGWSKIVGFHTRNVVHRSHEYIQLKALERAHADGLFVHPVIGKKKAGDFHAKPIIKSYEMMIKNFYPKERAIFATYATFSRYAGPREALFTALCRKNFGCSHFVVGRDHTGVGNFYHPKASHMIFDDFPDIGIIPVRFDRIFYSNKLKDHVHEGDDSDHRDDEKLHISGTQARKIFEEGKAPPEWFMRPEISNMILDMKKNGEQVFKE